MARFLGLNVQTDILVNVPEGTAPTTVARFRPDDLLACVATLSPTEPESLVVQVQRTDARADELVLGRVLRIVTEGGTEDSEWDITRIEDASTDDVLTIYGTPILMRLARVVYMGTAATTGAAAPEWTGVEQTATEWVNTLVLPALAAAGMPFELGTIDSTNRFTMDGEWSSILELVNAIAEPGRANAEVRLSMGGDYGYVLDLLDTIGGSAPTVRVRTAVNLLETKRERSLVEVATRLYPRGDEASVATRTMSDHLWRIASVVSGTVLELEDPMGGDGPIAYDDQLNGLYVAVLNDPTFASTVVTDSVAATQRITIGSTAGMTAGDLCRFFVGSGAAGQRVTSLAHPTMSLHPSDGGYGDRAQILDRAGVVADCNLIENATMRAWTVAADPPDGWTEFADDATDVTFTKVTTDSPNSAYSTFRMETDAGGETVFGAYVGGTSLDALQGPAVTVSAPLARPWNTSWRRYVATCWIKVDAAPASGRIDIYLHDESRAGAPKWRAAQDGGIVGVWTEGTDSEGVWIRYESAALDLSGNNPAGTALALTDATQLRVELSTDLGVAVTTNPAGTWQGRWDVATNYAANDYVSYANQVYYCSTAPSLGNTPPGTDWTLIGTPNRRADAGWNVLVGPVTLAESSEPIADREWSGGTLLWQEANAALATTANPIKGYDLSVADLYADDGDTYGTLQFVPGGTVIVMDTDLDVTTTLRLTEYTRDYLRPLNSQVRVGQPADTLTRLMDAGLVTTSGRV